MSSFKIEVNWTLNGVDMTSQTYTDFKYAHNYEGFGLGAPPVQIPHIKCVYVDVVISLSQI